MIDMATMIVIPACQARVVVENHDIAIALLKLLAGYVSPTEFLSLVKAVVPEMMDSATAFVTACLGTAI